MTEHGHIVSESQEMCDKCMERNQVLANLQTEVEVLKQEREEDRKAIREMLDFADPHRFHDSDDVDGYPHPRHCLDCSNPDEDIVELYWRASWPNEVKQTVIRAIGEYSGSATIRYCQSCGLLEHGSIACASIAPPFCVCNFYFATSGDSIGPQHARGCVVARGATAKRRE